MANSVPNPVQRLRYFDGEYLRSYDFTDEQTYHIEMRRLMNRKLHLYGIIYGLEIVQDDDSVPATNSYFFSIAPGMAIDKSGREIVVPAPYSLTDVLTGPGLSAGNNYEVWICYQESETGLPAAGYLDCNVQNQNTRWQEAFQVQLIPTQGASVVTSCGGVRLGIFTVIVSPSGFGLAIQGPVNLLQTYNVKRHYVGIRAQYLIAPDQVDPDSFDITAATTPVPDQPLPGYLDVQPGVFNHGNVIVKKNLVVGNDFALAGSSPPTPPSTGNVKVTGDLLLYGSFYGFNSTTGQWYGLQQYIQSLTPSIVAGSTTIPIPAQSGPITSGTATVSVPTTLPSGSQTQVVLGLSETVWQSPLTLADWSGNTNPITVAVTSTGPTYVGPGTWNLNIQWNVSPAINIPPASSTWILPVQTLVVSYIVVFTPPTP